MNNIIFGSLNLVIASIAIGIYLESPSFGVAFYNTGLALAYLCNHLLEGVKGDR